MLISTIIALSSIALLLLVEYLYSKKEKARYLVFSSVGDRSNAKTWVSGPDKKIFDLVFYYYGDNDIPDSGADIVIKRKGMKFENFYHFLNNNDVRQYEAIWVPDDDMVIDTASINRMFELFSRYRLKLAQPSFAKGSKIPWQVTRNNPDCILRYTNFVENNSVILSTDIIPLLMESFLHAGTGYGVDFIWPKLLGFPEDEIAVLDEVSCQHPISDYSPLDEVVPRELHKVQGVELLKKYGLLAENFSATEAALAAPYEIREYSRVTK